MVDRTLNLANVMALQREHLALGSPSAACHAEGLQVNVVDTTMDFAALRKEWSELLASSRSDCFFLTWEWLHSWWIHIGQKKRRLYIITVKSGSQLIGLAPLTVTCPRGGLFPFPVLEFAGSGTVGSDYLDIIIRRTWETTALEAITTFLAGKQMSIRLPRLTQATAVALDLGRGLRDLGWKCVEVPMEVCPFIDLPAVSWDAYLGTLGPSHRSNFKRRLKNLNREYDVRLQYAVSDHERREALQQLVTLHLQRWRPRGGSDAFDKPDLLAFHEEVSRLARECGWLRLASLVLDGVTVAALYGFRYRDTFHFYQSGFDSAFQRYSVGLVMMGLTIRGAIEEGIREYDLLNGDESYKFLWANQVRQLVRLELYPPTSLGRFHWRSTRMTMAVKNRAKRLLKGSLESVRTRLSQGEPHA